MKFQRLSYFLLQFTTDKLQFTTDKLQFTTDKLHPTTDKLHFTTDKLLGEFFISGAILCAACRLVFALSALLFAACRFC